MRKQSLKLKVFNKMPAMVRTAILQKKMPHSFIVEVTNACNQKCPACPWHSVMKRDIDFLTFEKFQEVLGKIEKYAKNISFYLMGEPFLNKDIFKMIRLCNEKGINTLISSNAMLVGNHIDEILNSGLTTLQLTMDGFTKESHEKYRVGSNFELVKDNIKKISEEKRERGLKKPEIHIQTLLFEHNKNELKTIENFAREIGVDKYSVKFPTVSAGYGDEKRGDFVKEFMLKEKNVEGYDRTKEGDEKRFYKNQSFCPQLTHCVVLVNGDVVPCCFDFDGSAKFGNIYEESLEKIWGNDKKRSFIKKFFYKANPLCNRCDMVDERGISVF